MKKNHAIADKAAGRIAKGILKIQSRFASTLSKLSASWKTRQQWIFLYMVCLVFGGLSVVAVIQPFNKKASNVLSKPSAIRTPRMLPDENRNSVTITEDEFRKVHAFKESLDSVTKKKLLARHPGLMDSLEMVEQLYYSQKK